MINLKSLSKTIPHNFPLVLKLWLLLFLVVGFLDSSVLLSEHQSGIQIPCTITNGCGEVLSSKYASFYGIPLAQIGVYYYLFIGVLLGFFVNYKSRAILMALFVSTFFGFLASLWFTYLQVSVIKTLCQYCLLSAISSTFIFVIISYLVIKYTKLSGKS